MANRYWVGTSGGNWDASTTTGWASSSGGAGGSSAPTSVDDVFFDANSGTGAVNILTGAVCRSVDCTGYIGTWASSGQLSVYGDFKLAAGMTITYSGTITFASTGSQIITTSGKSLPCSLIFNGSGGTWTLQDALTTTGFKVTLTAGTLNANNYNVSLTRFNSTGGSTRTLATGTGTWTVTGPDSGTDYAWNCGTSVFGLTVTGTGTIDLTGGGTNSFYGGGVSWPTLNCGASNVDIYGSNTFANITNTVVGTLRLASFTSQTVSSFNVNGTSAGSRFAILPISIPASLSKSGGQVSIQFCSITNVTATGTCNWFALDINGNIFSGTTTGWIRASSGLLDFVS